VTEWEPETSREFRALAEQTTDLLSVLDASGTIRYQSPSARHILGEDPSERVGDNAFEYVHPEDRERVAQRFVEMVESPRTTTERIEYRFEHGDGSWMWVESTGSNRTDSAIDGYVVSSRDVTARKERERQLEVQNKRLDEFVSVVSHDLRTPLSVLNGRLELAAESGDPEHIERCHRAVDRMNRLIDDLLTLCREGTVEIDASAVELATVSEGIWSHLDADGARLVTATDRSVLADVDRLYQLLENLFRNSVEHGGADVTVTVDDCEGGFYVADDGPGIPEDRAGKVFDAGFSTTESGTGFGLRIVAEIADEHGWDVTLADAGGARFEITGVDRP
jgi:PAS domain S-box-containing protein